MPACYAVFGQPIAHSLSPCIHLAFAAQCAIALDYRAIETGRADFPERLAQFARAGGCGANVTLPLKHDAHLACATLTTRAQRCASVNTLRRNDDATWHGDSTDGVGLLRDLAERHSFDPGGKRIVLLGAGGAAWAAACALIDAGSDELLIANRTPERVIALVQAIADPRARAVDWRGALARADVDLVINATSAGHAGAAFDADVWVALTSRDSGTTATTSARSSSLAPHTACYDLSYGPTASRFLAWARAAGATRVSDGLGMLVEQAAESFALWHGKRPLTAPVYAALRAQLAATSA